MANRFNDDVPTLPPKPVDRIIKPLVRFMHVEAASGGVLLICTVAALILANSAVADSFLAIWKTKVGFQVGSFQFRHPLYHLINDGLMAIFFFVIGLEVKRELVIGELRDLRRAALPIFAALGGMIAPAGLYILFLQQQGAEGMRGWGIPMATDIAFVVGCMAVLGSRVPHSLRIVLLSLAIADDIGAILVIAIGYTDKLYFGWLLIGAGLIGVVFLCSRLGVRSFGVYTVLGTFVWFAFHESGIHATIAGVILGLMTPARPYLSKTFVGRMLTRANEVLHGNWESLSHRTDKVRTLQRAARESISPLEYLENLLHPWVGFAIMPIFALANAGVPIELSVLKSPIAVAVMLGLFVGKPLGIFAFSWLAVKFGLARLPEGLRWSSIVAGGFLAGIGFTMALFIAGLAFKDLPEQLVVAKVGILFGSLAAAVVGVSLMLVFLPKPTEET